MIDRLLEAERPRAAFHAVHLDWPRIETARLKRLLFARAESAESADHYRLEAYWISKALDSLDGRGGINPDEMARLEFMYIEALDHSEHGVPNLERWVVESPIAFVQALALSFKRRDDGQDPSEWRIENPEQRTGMARAAYSLLRQVSRIPGTGANGRIDAEALYAWITEIRRLCAEHGRTRIGDQYIGQLLSRSPVGDNGFWPCLPVCEAMERIASHEIDAGFNIGVRNGRGVTSRAIGEGGTQERELAARYRGWARELAIDYPYVESVLESIATDYDREAGRHDDEAELDWRLQH